MEKIARILDRIVEIAIYSLVFIIPFSKAGIEIFATIAIIAWVIAGLLRCFTPRNDVFVPSWPNPLPKRVEGIIRFFPQTPLNKPILALFALSFISMITSVNINLSMEGVFFKLAEYVLIFFICAGIFSRKKAGDKKLMILAGVILASVILLFTDAVFQWITCRDFIRGFKAIVRLTACFSNTNDFAGYIIVILPILFCLIFFEFIKEKKILRRIIKFGSAVLFLLGFILLATTFSRGAWLGYLISMLFMGIIGLLTNKKQQKIFAILTIVFVCATLIGGLLSARSIRKRFIGMTTGVEAAGNRLHQWKEAMSIIEDFPVLGTGPNTYTTVASHYKTTIATGSYPHNSYLQMVAEIGLLGFGAFLWVLWRFFHTGIRLVFAKGGVTSVGRFVHNDEFLLMGIMAGVLATLAQSFFDTNLFALRLATMFWIMLGIGTGRMAILSQEKN
ncbi:O-antigen ligase family protein [Candidatus Omnitrophota bacterium]